MLHWRIQSSCYTGGFIDRDEFVSEKQNKHGDISKLQNISD